MRTASSTLRDEYPQVGGHYEVVHHTQLLNTLVRDGKLTPVSSVSEKATYHDPCYLGRHNKVYSPPRDLIAASGAEFTEMPRNSDRGFCCGAGGARMWMEEKIGKRVNTERTEEPDRHRSRLIAISSPVLPGDAQRWCLGSAVRGRAPRSRCRWWTSPSLAARPPRTARPPTAHHAAHFVQRRRSSSATVRCTRATSLLACQRRFTSMVLRELASSTVAARYVDEHQGSLLADIDLLRTLIGGWRDDFEGAGQFVRPLAHTMISTHLSGGHDVVMPQFLSDAGEVEEFERTAASVGAHFIEIALMADVDVVVQRFRQRRPAPDDQAATVIAAFVDGAGGERYLRRLHEDLLMSLEARPEAMIVQSLPNDEPATYRAVVQAIDDRSR